MTDQLDPHDRLAEELAHLAETLDRQNSWARRFLLGIAGGVGTALGATVIAGVVLFMLGNVLAQTPWQDLIGDALMQTGQNVQQAPTNNR